MANQAIQRWSDWLLKVASTITTIGPVHISCARLELLRVESNRMEQWPNFFGEFILNQEFHFEPSFLLFFFCRARCLSATCDYCEKRVCRNRHFQSRVCYVSAPEDRFVITIFLFYLLGEFVNPVTFFSKPSHLNPVPILRQIWVCGRSYHQLGNNMGIWAEFFAFWTCEGEKRIMSSHGSFLYQIQTWAMRTSSGRS